jgi:hypothetical protein
MVRTCFYCGKEMDVSESFMIALDTPYYANIFVHKNTCLKEIESKGISKFISDNSNVIKEISYRVENSKKPIKKVEKEKK